MKVDGRPNPANPHSAAGGAGIHPRRVRDTGETYDCVIVGAGISGLATAKWYRDRFGADSRMFSVAIRLWPPAKSRASPSGRASSSMA